MKKDIIYFLESLVHKRFTFEKLEEYLQTFSKQYRVKLYINDLDEKAVIKEIDYSFIGTMENDEILCDIDIYYAKTRAGDCYITEVAYEFESKEV